MPSAEDLAERAAAGPSGVPVGDFLLDTAVTPDAQLPGRFLADLSEAWRVFYAFGGCTMAVALRAAQAAVARPDLTPQVASALFVAPVHCGPLVVDTEVLRNGRSAAQVTAKLRSAGSPDGQSDVHLTAVFGAPHESRINFIDAVWPADALDLADAVVPPERDEDSNPFSRINYHAQTDFRMAMNGFNFHDPATWEPGPARALTWHRLRNEPLLPDGTYDPISLCAPADILGPAIFAKLGPMSPENPPFLVLSLEITVHFVAPATSGWIMQHTRVPFAANGYADAVVELWDEHHTLVALATQRGHVRPVTFDRSTPDGTA